MTPLPSTLTRALEDYRSAVLHLETVEPDPRARRDLQLRSGRELEASRSPAAAAELDRRQARAALHRTAEAAALVDFTPPRTGEPAAEPERATTPQARQAPPAAGGGAGSRSTPPCGGLAPPRPAPPLGAPGGPPGGAAPEGTLDGSARLARWLAGEGRGVRALARDLDVAPSTVSRWPTGERVPGLDVRARLEALTGIPASTWPPPRNRWNTDRRT